MADNSGICYTWSGDKKIYESGELSISPDKVKFVDFDNRYAKPFIQYIFTSSNNPPGISLEEGTAMYTVGLRDSDIDINNNNYLTYTPPDGYELVSEDNKNDPGVEEYYMSKKFYCDPSITVYYGTAAKSFTYLTGGKTFYYKEIPAPPPDTHHVFYVYVSVSSNSPGTISCRCNGVGIFGGDHTLALSGFMYYDAEDRDDFEYFSFSWLMKDGIDTSEPCRHIWPCYMALGFDTQSSWEIDNGDGSKTYYEFEIR